LYHHLRIATCASLIFFTGVVAVGALMLLSRVTGSPPSADVRAGISRPPAPSPLESVDLQVGSSANAAGPAATGTPVAAESAREEPAAKAAEATVSAERPAQAAQASVAAQPVPEKEMLAAAHAPASAPAAAGETRHRRAAKAGALHQILRRTAHRERSARRPSKEASTVIPRLGEPRRDIRLDAYAAEQIPRRIPIRPTSIQDVYYYSVPR